MNSSMNPSSHCSHLYASARAKYIGPSPMICNITYIIYDHPWSSRDNGLCPKPQSTTRWPSGNTSPLSALDTIWSIMIPLNSTALATSSNRHLGLPSPMPWSSSSSVAAP
ncbi:hypothetical protein ACN42_g5353 [Penicillium freii]|uniref:Uncharacterized protein n=1 Tax=Penicillium freii TaxID=48697 RepID=A0A101MJL9_PENFR|nr:hypothetical protein ACN42_g5353 [Penicillium freii]